MTAAALLIDCWESASRPHPWPGAVAMLLPAAGGEDAESLAHVPVGRRDGRLLELRRRLFGEGMEALASCPGCGLTVELSLHVGDLQVQPPADAPLVVEHQAWSVEFRLPDSRDLDAAAACTQVDDARRLLVGRRAAAP